MHIGIHPIADEGVDFSRSINRYLLLVSSSQEWTNASDGPGRSKMVISSLGCQCSLKGPEEEIEARPPITFEATSKEADVQMTTQAVTANWKKSTISPLPQGIPYL